MSINKVIIVGNLGKDPEIRTTQDGKEIANFSLATSESWKDKATGEKKQKTEWHRICVFSQGLVGVVKNYVKKGSKIYIEGQLQTRKWIDNQGIEKYSTEIILQGFNATLVLLDNKGSNPSGGTLPDDEQRPKTYSANKEPSAEDLSDLDDEVPF